MAKVTLYDGIQRLHTGDGLTTDSPILAVSEEARLYGAFRSKTRTTAGTTAVITPISGGSLILTDLLISGEKQATSSVEVRFTDGSNTVTVFLVSQSDAPASLAHSFAGRFHGWKDARVDMITTGAGDATVTIGYYKINGSRTLPFEAWDALR